MNALTECEANLVQWHEYDNLTAADDGGEPDALVVQALVDDLNTPLVISEMHRLKKTGQMTILARSLRFLGLLNSTLFGRERAAIAKQETTPDKRRTIGTWVEARDAARKAKNFTEADRIRDELAAMGVVLKDTKEGTTWEIAR